MLFQEFGINYNNEPPLFRKGTTLIRKLIADGTGRLKTAVVPLVDDIIGDRFWEENPEVIGLKSLATYQPPNQVNNAVNPMRTAKPPSPNAKMNPVNNTPPPPIANANSMNEEINPTNRRDSDGERMQCESERVCRR